MHAQAFCNLRIAYLVSITNLADTCKVLLRSCAKWNTVRRMAMHVPVEMKPWAAAWLIERRADKGWTQLEAIRELAAIGVKPGTYTNWEAGSRRPTPEWLSAIAQFYGVDVPTAPVVEKPKSDMERLIESNLGLTHAISLLVNALRPAGQSQAERSAALSAQIDALGAELEALQRAGAVEPLRQPESQPQARG